MDVKRKGKQLWMTLSGPGPSVLFHFGMTGSVLVQGTTALELKSVQTNSTVWPPKFCKLELELSGGIRIAFRDPRRLGRIRLREDPANSPPISLLAPDPISDHLDLARATAILMKTTAPLKAVLLDQSRLVCGVGNWVADDVLYDASIHPAARCSDLSNQQIKRLLASVISVCKTACAVSADSARFPNHWIFHHRWTMRPKTSITLDDSRTLTSEILGKNCSETLTHASHTYIWAAREWSATKAREWSFCKLFLPMWPFVADHV